MGTGQKVLTTLLWALMVLGMLGLVGTRVWLSRSTQATPLRAVTPLPEQNHQGLPVLFGVPSFQLIDQNGQPFTDEKLRGRPWVGCFVFTHCAGPCPVMFAKMAEIQPDLLKAGVRQVCFTVDPERDTPVVLKAKAHELGAEESTWFFLTSDRPTIEKFMREMFQPKPGQGDDPLMHDSQFYLFDAQGQCRGRYSSKRADEIDDLKKDAETLAQEAKKQGSGATAGGGKAS